MEKQSVGGSASLSFLPFSESSVYDPWLDLVPSWQNPNGGTPGLAVPTSSKSIY